jgi:tryptophanyl-tRNA synthetase
MWEFFEPMRTRRAEILAQPDYVDEVLARGAERANQIADNVMCRVRGAVGL